MSVVQSYSNQTLAQQDLANYFARDLIQSGIRFFLAADSSDGNTTTIFSRYADSNPSSFSPIRTGIDGTNASLTVLKNERVAVVTETDIGLNFRDASVSNGANIAFGAGAREPDITTPAGGGVVIAAELAGHIQIYLKTNAGVAIADFTVDTNANVDANPSVTALADGSFAVAWDRTVGSATELWTAVYYGNGSVRKAPTALDTDGTFNRTADVQKLASGGFVVTYENDAGLNSFGERETQVALKILDAAGVEVRTILTPAWVNDDLSRPHVSQMPNGWLMVTANNDWAGSIFDTDVNGFIVDPATGDFIVGSPFPELIQGEEGLQGYSFNRAFLGQDGKSLVIYANGSDDFTGMRAVVQQLVATSTGDDADDTAVGSVFIDIMDGGGGNDQLYGGGNNDHLTGGAGDDILDGGTGSDTMIGGAGADSYTVDSNGDVVTETADDASRDTVYVGFDYTLPNYVENLVLTNIGRVIGIGNELDNWLTSTATSNRLDGLDGNDTIDGMSMRGGLGDDLYIVNDIRDRTREAVAEGIDTVHSFITHTLFDNVENLQLQGTGNINGTGNSLDNMLEGNSGNNTLTGGAGSDVLVGGLGADSLSGGDGADYLRIDAADTSIQGGAGFDSAFVQTSAAVSLNMGTASIEWGQGNAGNDTFNAASQTGAVYIYGMGGDDTLTGSAFGDYLDGGDGTDTLAGGDGADLMLGNGGVDILRGEGGDDSIIELGGDSVIDGGAGFDSLFVWSDTGVTLDLTAASIEWVQGSVLGDDDLDGAGNTVNTFLYGWGGNDVLTAGSADDYIAGGAGDDVLTGGAGNDTLIGETGFDRYVYTDTVWGSDTIHSFDANGEKLDFTSVAGIDSFSDFTTSEWDPGGLGFNSTTLFYTHGGTTSAITLIGVQTVNLSDADFLFA